MLVNCKFFFDILLTVLIEFKVNMQVFGVPGRGKRWKGRFSFLAIDLKREFQYNTT